MQMWETGSRWFTGPRFSLAVPQAPRCTGSFLGRWLPDPRNRAASRRTPGWEGRARTHPASYPSASFLHGSQWGRQGHLRENWHRLRTNSGSKQKAEAKLFSPTEFIRNKGIRLHPFAKLVGLATDQHRHVKGFGHQGDLRRPDTWHDVAVGQ